MVSVSFPFFLFPFFFFPWFDLHIFEFALTPFYHVSTFSLMGKEPIKAAYRILHTWTKIACVQKEAERLIL